MIPFPKRWHHGHSIVVGILGGLLLSYRPWLILAAGVAIGVGGTFAVLGGVRLARELRAAWRSWRMSTSHRRPAPRKVRAPLKTSQSDEIPF